MYQGSIDTSWLHLLVSGWRGRAWWGSRKRITPSHARPRPLRHSSQRCRPPGGGRQLLGRYVSGLL